MAPATRPCGGCRTSATPPPPLVSVVMALPTKIGSMGVRMNAWARSILCECAVAPPERGALRGCRRGARPRLYPATSHVVPRALMPFVRCQPSPRSSWSCHRHHGRPGMQALSSRGRSEGAATAPRGPPKRYRDAQLAEIGSGRRGGSAALAEIKAVVAGPARGLAAPWRRCGHLNACCRRRPQDAGEGDDGEDPIDEATSRMPTLPANADAASLLSEEGQRVVRMVSSTRRCRPASRVG